MTEQRPEEWTVCQPVGMMAFTELERYTRSDDWETLDGVFVSEDEALEEIRSLQSLPSGDADGWYATRKLDGLYVETIVPPVRVEAGLCEECGAQAKVVCAEQNGRRFERTDGSFGESDVHLCAECAEDWISGTV